MRSVRVFVLQADVADLTSQHSKVPGGAWGQQEDGEEAWGVPSCGQGVETPGSLWLHSAVGSGLCGCRENDLRLRSACCLGL